MEPILSGILVAAGLYTVNYAVLGGQSNLYLQYDTVNAAGSPVKEASPTVYKGFSSLFSRVESPFLDANAQVLLLTLAIVALLTAALGVFFFTRPGMAIRATGDNEEMVRASSINADLARTGGVMLANSLVALSGALLCQQQRYADLNCGSSMLVMGLASVIIGQVLFGDRGIVGGLISAVGGSLVYRVVIQAAYKVNMPSYTVKLLSTLIVVCALAVPLIKRKLASTGKGAAA